MSIWGNEYRVISMPNDQYNGWQRLIYDGCINEFGTVVNDVKYKEHVTPRTGQILVMASFKNTIVDY